MCHFLIVTISSSASFLVSSFSSGGGHGGELPVGKRLCVHHGRPDPAVQHGETPGQRHQPHQRGEEEGQRQGRKGEEEAAAAGGRKGKSQEGDVEGTGRHVQVKLKCFTCHTNCLWPNRFSLIIAFDHPSTGVQVIWSALPPSLAPSGCFSLCPAGDISIHHINQSGGDREMVVWVMSSVLLEAQLWVVKMCTWIKLYFRIKVCLWWWKLNKLNSRSTCFYIRSWPN